jgi:hypothetical protein
MGVALVEPNTGFGNLHRIYRETEETLLDKFAAPVAAPVNRSYLRLFLITRKEAPSYDQYFGFVVAAHDKEDAHAMLSELNSRAWVRSPEDTDCRLIGIAVPGVQRGIILDSFRTG